MGGKIAVMFDGFQGIVGLEIELFSFSGEGSRVELLESGDLQLESSSSVLSFYDDIKFIYGGWSFRGDWEGFRAIWCCNEILGGTPRCRSTYPRPPFWRVRSLSIFEIAIQVKEFEYDELLEDGGSGWWGHVTHVVVIHVLLVLGFVLSGLYECSLRGLVSQPVGSIGSLDSSLHLVVSGPSLGVHEPCVGVESKITIEVVTPLFGCARTMDHDEVVYLGRHTYLPRIILSGGRNLAAIGKWGRRTLVTGNGIWCRTQVSWRFVQPQL